MAECVTYEYVYLYMQKYLKPKMQVIEKGLLYHCFQFWNFIVFVWNWDNKFLFQEPV